MEEKSEVSVLEMPILLKLLEQPKMPNLKRLPKYKRQEVEIFQVHLRDFIQDWRTRNLIVEEGEIAAKEGNLGQAIELYERAEAYPRAAWFALCNKMFERAIELYIHAKEYPIAALIAYDKGNEEQARELFARNESELIKSFSAFLGKKGRARQYIPPLSLDDVLAGIPVTRNIFQNERLTYEKLTLYKNNEAYKDKGLQKYQQFCTAAELAHHLGMTDECFMYLLTASFTPQYKTWSIGTGKRISTPIGEYIDNSEWKYFRDESLVPKAIDEARRTGRMYEQAILLSVAKNLSKTLNSPTFEGRIREKMFQTLLQVDSV